MNQAIAAITTEPNSEFQIESVSIEDPQAGEVLVDIKAVGVCHTDLAMVAGAFGTQFPAVFGHEGAGIVAAVGDGVTKVKTGDKVLLTFNSCGDCNRCDSDQPSYCEQFMPMNMGCVRSDGSTRITMGDQKLSDNFFGQSSFASKAIANQRNIVKLDDSADLATMAPLGCGVQTGAGAVMRSLDAQPGQSLVVIGGGAVGLSAILGGKVAKCGSIILIEPTEHRRKLALELGADHVIDPAEGDTAEAVRALIPAGVDLVVDTSGYVPALSSSVNMLANRGKLGIIGVPSDLQAVLPVPIIQWLAIGGTLRGISEGDSVPDEFIPELIEHYENGDLPFDKFVTMYPFEDINQAIDDAHSGEVVKVVLTF